MKKFKCIILAGGKGTRLYPMTQLYSKQLINIYDKPMIYYPLSLAMLVDIKDFLIIADPPTLNMYVGLFGGGSRLGINIEYKTQLQPKGIAESFIIGEEFIGDDNVMLVLGDNIFYGDTDFLRIPMKEHERATVFAYYVDDPKKYGVIQFNKYGKIISIEEKPVLPKSNYAIPGLYLYDNSVVDIAKNMKPSNRGELEITDINIEYLKRDELKVSKIGRGIAWLDTGTPDFLMEANNFVSILEKRQGLKIGCLEEIAFNKGYITKKKFLEVITEIPESEYKRYLANIYMENLL